MGALNSLGNIIGAVIGLAIIAVLATHPTIVSDFFTGVSTDVKSAEVG